MSEGDVKGQCPHCGNLYILPIKAIGKRAKCKQCHIVFDVPDSKISKPITSNATLKKTKIWSLVGAVGIVGIITIVTVIFLRLSFQTEHAIIATWPVFEMRKPQLLKYFESKDLHIGPEAYMNQEQLSVFPLSKSIGIRVVWQKPDYHDVESILIANTSVEHSSVGVEPVIAAWKLIQPDMVPLFDDLEADYPTQLVSSELRWYKNGPYAYGVAPNNKYFVEHIGAKSAISELKKQHLECATIFLSWFNEIDTSKQRYRKQATSILSNPNPSNVKLLKKILKDELGLLAGKFESVQIYDIRDSDPIDDVNFFAYYIPPAFNDKAKGTLLKAAGAVYRLAFLAQQQCRGGDIGFVAYDELIGAVAEAMGAIEQIWGDYSRLEGHEGSTTLPREYQEKFEDIAVLAVAVQMYRK